MSAFIHYIDRARGYTDDGPYTSLKDATHHARRDIPQHAAAGTPVVVMMADGTGADQVWHAPGECPPSLHEAVAELRASTGVQPC